MFRKLNNQTLAVIFVVLLIIAVVIIFFDTGKNERTFRDVLVDIDTSAVTEIHIISKANDYKPVRLFKKDNKWLVELNNGKDAAVTNQKIQQTFTELLSVVPKRLAARGKDKWAEFQVDSSGTRVQVMEGDSKTLDLVIGRFNYQQQPRSISTYVRLANDNDVYEVDGFLSLTFNQNANAFRDGSVLKADYNTWKQLVFDYPADSSFTLTKTNNKWYIDQQPTDSAKTTTYLRTLANLSRNNFADTVKVEGETPNYKLSISNANLEFTEIDAYVDPEHTVIVSSQNPDTKFDGKTFFKNIFVSKNSFFK